jgi:hypothetical protein
MGTHILIPSRIRKRDLVPKRLQRLRLIGPRNGCLGRRDRLFRYRSLFLGRLGLGFRLRVEAADLQLPFPLVEDALVMVLPELL